MTLMGMARHVREHPLLAGSEWAEVFSFELIARAANNRDFERDRPGWQPYLSRIVARAETFRDLAFESLMNDRQELLRFGHAIPRLYTVGAPEQLDADRQLYRALPPGSPYRLDGKIQRKRAA
jgi:hypothetical protein